jgi:hypothetical protein
VSSQVVKFQVCTLLSGSGMDGEHAVHQAGHLGFWRSRVLLVLLGRPCGDLA